MGRLLHVTADDEFWMAASSDNSANQGASRLVSY
jgi:hypothetical protein